MKRIPPVWLAAVLLASSLPPSTAAGQAGSWIIPSTVFRTGTNAAEFRSDVRILNLGSAVVTVTASFYDQVTGQTLSAAPFQITARNQASFDNILASLFGRTLAQGAYGPIRFQATGPIVVSSGVNNVNACLSGAKSGMWLPGIEEAQAMLAGALGQLAASSTASGGYRTNVVFVNPGNAAATVHAKVRRGGGSLLSEGTIGPLGANGFRQVALDDTSVFPGVAGTTDTNLWLEFTSDKPVLAFASVINNASGDPYAIVATADRGTSAPATEEITVTLPGGVPLVMVRIPAGTFLMGSPTSERLRNADETQHMVTLTSDYYMGKYEVTQAQWQAVMGTTPWATTCGNNGVGGSYPTYCVDWPTIVDGYLGGPGFLQKLNSHLTATGQPGAGKYRLPTEAEWEKAARGGTTTRFFFGDALDCPDASCQACSTADPYLWWCGNASPRATHSVGLKTANPFGVYDMDGNVWEWCQDIYAQYPSTPQTNPQGPSSGSMRVARGGSADEYLRYCRSASRNFYAPAYVNKWFGFRLARSL
ncbi:MAG: formylglycine-generating enzyme family protein [Holophagales bacterium]|nr:formylglycine-generating enzyme family protein [Holophagales bacterium]